MTMKWPTSESREKKLIAQAEVLDRAVRNLRSTSVDYKNELASTTTTVQKSIDHYEYYVEQLENLQELTSDRNVLTIHSRNIGIGQIFETDSDVDVTNDRFLIENPEYRTSDRVRMTATGVSTLPSPFQANTNYFVTNVDSTGFQLAASDADSQTGTAIGIDTTGTGEFRIEARLNNAGGEVNAALQNVINTIDAGAPKDAEGYVQSYQLDPTGATGENGIVYRTVNPSQTTSLQTALQDLIDAIEAAAA